MPHLLIFFTYCSLGMNKLGVNHLDKHFVAIDAAIVVNELLGQLQRL